MAHQRPLREFDVAGAVAFDAHGAAKIGGSSTISARNPRPACSILSSTSSDSLNPSGPNSLMPLSSKEIVRSRNHDPDVGPHRMRQHGDGRGRHWSEQRCPCRRSKACNHGVFDHIARQPRILADHSSMAVFAALKQDDRRLRDFHRKFRRDHLVGWSPRIPSVPKCLRTIVLVLKQPDKAMQA